ncbi:hypothetical protein [Ferruginibacter sp. SUN106]|uniref:hypothetical protein n=1 Tax=Ferruginibacter sp. SUN106 TaxID=2978348 RepID=UPI003D3623BF
MAANLDDDQPIDPENIPPQSTADEAIAATDTAAVITNQASDTMEVHHHGHHGHEKKNWKNYFWEFFMLFLAVFCGSLAELQVEHYIEHNREKKYAQTLIEDLVSDSLDLNKDIQFWNTLANRTDTIRREIEKPQPMRNQFLLYKCIRLIKANNTFLYHDRTIQQLKSSGNFRLIRNKEIADSIVNYDAWIQKTINDIENIYGHVLSPQMSEVENQLYNSKFFEVGNNKEKFDSLLLDNPGSILIKDDKADLQFQYYNKLWDYKSLTKARIYFLSSLLRRGTNLIALLNKEYHFE